MTKNTLPTVDAAWDIGTRLEGLLITDLTIDGKGLARHQGRVVFLEQGLPGDMVSARVTGLKKHIVFADVTLFSTRSPHLVTPWCPHAFECGGCLWQHFAPEAARDWKEKHISETIARIGKCPGLSVSRIVPSSQARAFRNKMTFAAASDAENTLTFGLHRRWSHSLIEVADCGLLPQPGMRILAKAKEIGRRLGLSAWQNGRAGRDREKSRRAGQGYIRFLVVHTPAWSEPGLPHILVECITGPAHNRTIPQSGLKNSDALALLGRELTDAFQLTGFVHSERQDAAQRAQGERLVTVIGSSEYKERFGHLVLSVPYSAFVQTNTEMASRLYASAVEEANPRGDEVLWDIYSGIGSIALFFGHKVKEAHGVELQADAVIAANKNSAALGYAHCRFHAGRLTPELAASLPRPDIIVVDPPRAGLESAAVRALNESGAGTLLYISCDVATQARDLVHLAPAWTPVKSVPFDMFPYTPHVENMIVLKARA